MEEKYIQLLLKRCINIEKSKSLFINFDSINKPFIDKLVLAAYDLGINDIYLDENDIHFEHDILKNIELDEIEKHSYFNRNMWDYYAAERRSNFLIFRAPVPGVMDDIEASKIAKADFVKRNTSSKYRRLQFLYEIPWCIAALPNKVWADKVFEGKENSLELLENAIYKGCMVDTSDPIKSWDEHIEKNKIIIEKLNKLKIKLLHYKNKLGTDLTIELLQNSIWCDASNNGIVNMPSYEIFSSPNFNKTNGIVYSSTPLFYNGGLIDNFWIKFENGKAVEFDAMVGKELLKRILASDSNACYLGECALVEENSPISKTGVTFGITLFDENRKTHLALGEGFITCTTNSEKLTDEEILSKGINLSNVHVDFMIGTPDLEIVAETFDKKKVKIFENGNFTDFLKK